MAYVCWCGRPGAERVGRAPRRRSPSWPRMNRTAGVGRSDMYNVLHSASSPGPSDAFRPRGRGYGANASASAVAEVCHESSRLSPSRAAVL